MLVYKVDFNIDCKGAIVAMPSKSSHTALIQTTN